MNRYFRSFLLFALGAVLTLPSMAQERLDTLKLWDLAHYSQATLNDLAADTERWEPMSKNGTLQRYANKIDTDGLPTVANGNPVRELEGLIVGAGITPGSFLLRHNMGETQNGMQMQRVVPITIPGMKKGDELHINIKSSSKDLAGIATITNMEGACGSETYTTTSFKDYVFTITADGEVSFTIGGAVVIKTIAVVRRHADTRQQVETPVITQEGNSIIITSATPGAVCYYTLSANGAFEDNSCRYDAPFTISHSCVVRAIATKEGMKDSEEARLNAVIELDNPNAGRPFVLDPEKLDRAFIATETPSGMLLNWRWLITDPDNLVFTLYRDGAPISAQLKNRATTFLDKSGKTQNRYTLEVRQGETLLETLEARILRNGYWEIALNRPASGTTQSGEYGYVPGDCMVGDVDGDGVYELIMKWDPDNQKDNSHSGYTGNVLIDCYRLSGEQLWRIDLGCNIRAGAHYTQLMVYDLDQDGKAELACKTAPGTIDGQNNYVLLDGDDPTADYRGTANGKGGVVIKGPEYLTVFSGLTGAALATTHYNPPRDTISNWGDNYGNRSERYLAAVAYLDGAHPSLVMCRGYYTSAFLWAVDFDGTSLQTRWLHASTKANQGAYGEGAHSISVGDVDADGCDEIIYGACAIDNDGSLMYRTGLGHGDAMHVGDLDPDRPGLEVMMVHEDAAAKYGVEMHDAWTGEIISGYYAGTDVGRGLCADVDPEARGCEYWSTADNGVYNVWGEQISTKRPTVNFRTYWDGDVQEEFCETGSIAKWQGRTQNTVTLVDFTAKYGAGTNLIKYTPCLQADIFGDWREEVIYYDEATKSRLWIFSTPYSCDFGVPTLMHDHHYRMATVWQTSAYNQPPHLSYYLPDYVEAIKAGSATAIDTIDRSNTICRVRYYDLMGRMLTAPSVGPTIVETEFIDGTRVREKVYNY